MKDRGACKSSAGQPRVKPEYDELEKNAEITRRS